MSGLLRVLSARDHGRGALAWPKHDYDWNRVRTRLAYRSITSGVQQLELGPRIKRYAVSSRTLQPSKPGCSVRAAAHCVTMDLPKLAGGNDEAPQPVEVLLAALLGCKTATAHFVARNAWPRKHNRIHAIEFCDVEAERDERGAITLPITDEPPVTAALLSVRGVARVRPTSTEITARDVAELGEMVDVRCPVAATLRQAGCLLNFQWVLDA